VAEPNRPVTFPHKRRLDGIYESICPRCFMTVGSNANEDDLIQSENTHVCFGLDLSELLRPKNQK
jgi:hypothetical protein